MPDMIDLQTAQARVAQLETELAQTKALLNNSIETSAILRDRCAELRDALSSLEHLFDWRHTPRK